jgi:hypothetical protein
MSAIPSWCRVGAKVVCVTEAANLSPGEAQLVVGSVYTIRSVERDEVSFGFILDEIKNPPIPYSDGMECFYDWHRFRPLVTIEDDLEAHFLHHLDVREPVGV